ncbi:hypothetical protein [Sphingobacterium faecale]|uniref:Uncharacterized protein n=1 Tax=Sphingobacterium faecale TaxID=2803775 RepID=A0ABS1R863_9SPHI|nr:hypothetical protein [Sphingobacterium faecale]MBL1410167.1 hypothetical protein [Sphingobacterium faecale]
MDNRINKDVLEVPMDFRIACESFGIQVADFLQLMVSQFAFVNLFGEDDSVYNLIVRSFMEAEEVLERQGGYKTNYSLADKANQALPIFKQLYKLGANRNYSWNAKRSRSKKIVDKLFLITGKDIRAQPKVYLDEDTAITLSRDFRIWSTIHNCPVIPVLNAMMQRVSLADLYARQHLDEIEYNPTLGMYLRIQQGYGDLVNRDHLNGLGFKDFLCDLQEFEMRYFLFHRLADRVEMYREQFLENYNEMNKANII